MNLAEILPSSAEGWIRQTPDQTYDRETIFRYIDGAGEIYLQYDFRRVLVREYVRAGAPKITAQVFDMGNSSDAYGMFSFEREEPDAGIGQESEYAAGLLRFWNGSLLVCVSSERETPEAREAILAIGRDAAGKIHDPGRRPDLLDVLPSEVSPRTSIRYFHGPFGLATHYPIGDGNPLMLSPRTDVVLSTCRFDESPSRLLIVRYSDVESARTAWTSFRSSFAPRLQDDGFAQMPGGRWVFARQEGRLIVGLFDVPDQARARTCVERTLEKTGGYSWSH